MIEDYTPNNFRDYLPHKRFHHKDKGCRMTLYRSESHKLQDENISIQSYCHTHSTQCSKSGWELGWFGGTDSKKEWQESRYELKTLQCKVCGVYFLVKDWALYCSDCRVITTKFYQRIYKCTPNNNTLKEYSNELLEVGIKYLTKRRERYRERASWYKVDEMNTPILNLQKELNERKYNNKDNKANKNNKNNKNKS